MKLRPFFPSLLALLLGVFTPAAVAASSRPPNVVLLLVDDWGWTDASCYGSKIYETPHLDRLAREGMRFTQAYSACTVCSPTRAALMTGKYPARLHLTDWIAGHNRPYAKLRIPDWTQHLPLEEKTIAEELQARGYATGLVGKWHLGGAAFFPEHQGFDFNFGGCEMGAPRSYFPPYGITNVTDEKPGEFLSDRLAREAVAFIEKNRDRPFFLYLPHYGVHTPLAGKPEVIEKYRKKIGGGETAHTNAVYAALVESVDDSLGMVMRKLEELHLAENTVVIVTGDNGGLSGTLNAQGWRPASTRNDPLRLGKGSAYEGGVRVPLVVKWPGVTAAGSVCPTPVISPDFFPTLLEIADSSSPGRSAPSYSTGLDGTSLGPLLRGGHALARTAVYWHYPHYHPGSATPYSAVRDGDWKLIHFFEDDHMELYDLATDIGEKNDLAKTRPDQAAVLRAQLDTWRKSVGAQLPTPNPAFDPARVWEADRPAGKKAGAKKKAG